MFCARGAFHCWAVVSTSYEAGVNLPSVSQRGKRGSLGGIPKRMVFQVYILTTSCPAWNLLGACRPALPPSFPPHTQGTNQARGYNELNGPQPLSDQREER